MDVVEIRTLFDLLYMADMLRASHMNIDDFYRTDGIGVEFFHLVMPKKSFCFYFEFYSLIMQILEMNDENWIDWQQFGKFMKNFDEYS